MEREHGAGLSFGRYQTLFRLGTGGMAEVFVARQLGEARFERLVALKRPLAHLARDSRYMARFLDEARLGACVQHPNVVQTLDVGASEEGDPFLVLELVVGMSLDRLLKAGALPWEVCVVWLAEAALGLHAAHQAQRADGAPLQLVHRDVSPHNVLVGSDGVARIGDFGIAQAALLKDAQTETGVVAGKLAYFSPEQARGQPLDARSDVFSLGIVAWEALTGQRLFAAEALGETLDRVRSLTPAAPHSLVPGIPHALSQVVLKALERERAARYQTAHAFAQALSQAGAQHAASRAACVALLAAREDEALRRVRARLFLASAAPTDAAPTDAAPTDAAPTNAAPTDAAPTDAAPTNAAPTNAAPTSVKAGRLGLPWLGLLLLVALGGSAWLLSSRAVQDPSASPAAREPIREPETAQDVAWAEHVAPSEPSPAPQAAAEAPQQTAIAPPKTRAKKTRREPKAVPTFSAPALPPQGLLGLDAFERASGPKKAAILPDVR